VVDDLGVRGEQLPVHPSRRDRRAAAEGGASLVEFALPLPLVFALFLGIFSGGATYFRKISVVDAVREGGRYGASLVVAAAPGGSVAWENQVKERVVDMSGGVLSVADVCAQLVFPTGGTECGVADPPGASQEASVHLVKVSASRPSTIEFVFFSRTVTLSAAMAARYERDTG